MQTELQKELDDDKAVYEILSCWCDKNEQEKTKAIELGEDKISALESEIAMAIAKIQELKETLKQAKDSINKNFDAVQQSASMRMKENKEFHTEETDLIEAIKACEQAIVVLSKHNPSMTQLSAVGRSLEGVAHSMMIPKMLNSVQAAALKMFVKEVGHPDSFLGTNTLAVPGYESGSGQILGILKQMKEEFESNLAEARKLEAKNVEDYAKLKAAKEQETIATKKLVQQSEADLAAFQEKHAQAVELLGDTKDQLKLDKEFLFNLKKRCAEGDKEYEERVKSRMEEINAVADTIAFLNSDEAFEMFDKTVNTAFVQVAAERQEEQRLRRRARAVLSKVAGSGSAESSQIALIAAAVQLDAFTKVIEMIDNLIKELKEQQADEVKEHDYCKEELNKNTLEMDKEYDKQEQLTAKISDLEETIKTLTEEMERTKSEDLRPGRNHQDAHR